MYYRVINNMYYIVLLRNGDFMKNLESVSITPLYQQLCDTLKEQIKAGKYKAGDKIPSEDQLSKMYKISRITVRNALQHLADENMLVKRKGKGTFVAEPVIIESMSAGNSFTKSCLQINAVPSTKIISMSKQHAGKKIAEILETSPEDFIICIKRLRLIDNMAAIFEVDYFTKDYDFLIQEDFTGTSLLEFIRKNTGIRAEGIEDIYEVRHASKEHAEYLDCKVGTPLLQVSQTVFMAEGKKLYYNEQYIRSDRYKYAIRSKIN